MSMIPNINLHLRSPKNLSCRFMCLLYTTRGQSHLSLNSFLSFFTTAWIDLLRPRLAYFPMKRESRLLIARDLLQAPEQPEVSSSSRIARRCGARQCGTKTLILLPRKSFLRFFTLTDLVFVTQLLVDATDFSN